MKKTLFAMLTLVLCVAFMAIPAMATSVWLEAETDAVLSEDSSVLEISKASGGAAVSVGEAAFEVEIDIADKYFVRIGHRAGEGLIVLTVDGVDYELGVGNAEYGTKWVILPLSVGSHEIKVRSEGDSAVLDYLSVYNYSNIPMGSDSPSAGYDNPYLNPDTSDIGYLTVILAIASLMTAFCVTVSFKRKKI